MHKLWTYDCGTSFHTVIKQLVGHVNSESVTLEMGFSDPIGIQKD